MELLYSGLAALFIFFSIFYLGYKFSYFYKKEENETSYELSPNMMERKSKPFVPELSYGEVYKGTIITYSKMRFGKYINRAYFATGTGKIPNIRNKFVAVKTSEKLVKNGYYATKFDLYAVQSLDYCNLNINYFMNLYDKTEGTNIKGILIDNADMLLEYISKIPINAITMSI